MNEDEYYRTMWVRYEVPNLYRTDPDQLSNRWYDAYNDYQEALYENSRDWELDEC